MSRPQTRKFGEYSVLNEIAQGGMGTVYRAQRDNEIFAIKAMHGMMALGQFDSLKAFRAEAALTLRLNHTNIVRAMEVGESPQGPYIVMEWVDGKTLREIIQQAVQKRTGFPAQFGVYIAAQVASALSYTHAQNLLHRDISPQNIMVSFNGRVRVIDFGIAKALYSDETTRSGVIKGKPSYLSPEQVFGHDVDHRTDIFSLGSVLWEMLTQRKLFQGKSAIEIIRAISECQSIEPPSRYNASVSPELDRVVLKALAKNPADRYANANDFRTALESVLRNLEPGSDRMRLQVNSAGMISQLFDIAPGEPELQIITQPQMPVTPEAYARAAPAPQERLVSTGMLELEPAAHLVLGSPNSRQQLLVAQKPAAPRQNRQSKGRARTRKDSPHRQQVYGYKELAPRPRETGLSGIAVLGIAAAILFFMGQKQMSKKNLNDQPIRMAQIQTLPSLDSNGIQMSEK